MLNCRQVTRLVSRSMDASLPWYQRLGIGFHLLYCVWCRRYAAQVHLLHQAAKELVPESPDAQGGKLPDDAKEQMSQRLQQALKSPPPGSQ